MGSDRATSPVVGKALEAGLVVLYIGLLSATLYGHVVPGYRTAAGAEIGDRVLAETAQEVQQAVPPDAAAVAVRLRVDLPETIRGRGYTIVAENRTLALDHPDPAIDSRARLALPPSVESVRGSWRSGEPAAVTVRGSPSGLRVALVEGSA